MCFADKYVHVPASCLIAPRKGRVVREINEAHVDVLARSIQLSQVWTGNPFLVTTESEVTDQHQLQQGNLHLETLAGNHRRLALEKLAMMDPMYRDMPVPVVVYIGLSPQESRAIAFHDNLSGEAKLAMSLPDMAKLMRLELFAAFDLEERGNVPNFMELLTHKGDTWRVTIARLFQKRVCDLFGIL